MLPQSAYPEKPPHTSSAPGQLWAIVLAGGEGVRLRPLIRRLYGEDRPKQNAALAGSRSLLRQTLDRVASLIAAERTVVVTARHHVRYLSAELAGRPSPKVLVQPADRGTAAGVLLPAHWIHRRDPDATVAVFPSDHFVLEELAFMGHVAEVAAFVRRHPEWIVLLGARPTDSETEYGWIEPGDTVDRTTAGPICRVRRFWEKSSERVALACFEGGCLWNTLVLVAGTSTLIEAGRQLLPTLHDRLARIAPFMGTEDEAWAIEQAYALAPKANFSREILERCPPFLVVSQLPPLTWSDLGTPERVLRTLRQAGIRPASAFPWPAVALAQPAPFRPPSGPSPRRAHW